MSNTEIQEALSKKLKYENYSSFVEATGLEITVGTNCEERFSITIDNIDKFYTSYSRSSYLTARKPNDNLFTEKETLPGLKSRLAAKLKQQRVLRDIKVNAIEEIKKFIANTFNVPKNLIDDEDIVFTRSSVFSIADNSFYYQGTIIDSSFIIQKSIWSTYKEMYTRVKSIEKYFTEKSTLKQDNDI